MPDAADDPRDAAARAYPPPPPDVGAVVPHDAGAAPSALAEPVQRPPTPQVTGLRFLDAALDKAISIPSAAVHAHVDKLRARNPYATPEQVIGMLEKEYLLAVSASGGAVGAAAAAPAVGTGVAMTLTASEVATFFAASAAFALGVADVHGIAIEDTARRRTLVLATVLGEQGARTVGAEAGLDTKAWARTLLVNMPTTTIRRVNSALTRRMLRRQAAKHGAVAFGRLVPFGIGAAIGVTGARSLGKTVVEGARKAFGPPPRSFPQTIEVVAAARDERMLPTRFHRPTRRIAGGRRDPHPPR